MGTTGARTATDTRSSRRKAQKVNTGQTSVVPSEILNPGQGRRGKRSGGSSLAAIAVGLVIAVIAAVFLAGVVFTILRVFELIVVALAAAWIGYHIGLFRGSRRR